MSLYNLCEALFLSVRCNGMSGKEISLLIEQY